MNKDEFKNLADGHITDHKTIVTLMKLIYESDIENFFPRVAWTKGNPVIEVYSKWLYNEDFNTRKLIYSDVVNDMSDIVMPYGKREDIGFYIANSCQIFLPDNYKRTDRT